MNINIHEMRCLKPPFHSQHIRLEPRASDGTHIRGDLVIKGSHGAQETILDIAVMCPTSLCGMPELNMPYCSRAAAKKQAGAEVACKSTMMTNALVCSRKCTDLHSMASGLLQHLHDHCKSVQLGTNA